MTEIVTGAAQGAAAGAAFGPPGLVVGGIIGAIGGVFGRKSRINKQRAAAARRKANQLRNFQVRRQYINSFLTAQGNALATGAISGASLDSSGVQGEMASLRTQATSGLVEYNELDRLDALSGAFESKASKYAGLSSMVGNIGNAAVTLKTEFPSKAATVEGPPVK